jgi:glyoxylase-like metal-dependent hydrolase (beta-lactamase superfamily II)
MPTSVTPAELYYEIEHGHVPLILDVRNQDEYATWQIEGPAPVAMRNVPIWVAVEDIDTLAPEVPNGTVVVCPHGNGAGMLHELLAEKGIQTRNLEGGTTAWAQLLVAKALPNLPEGMVGWQMQRPAKACLSYVLGVPGRNAVVIDPARFPDTYVALAEEHGMKITHVIDTHVHADHISGGPEMAVALGAEYHLPLEDAGGSVPFENRPLIDSEVLDLGDVHISTLAIKMPGHTPGTTCVHIPGHLLLTGDTVFVRGVGRPDLTGQADELAKELFYTVNDKLRPLDPATMVLPAHWSSPDEVGVDGLVRTDLGHVFESTLLNEEDLMAFVQEIVTSLPSAPATYDTIREVNAGKKVSADELEFLEIGKNQCAATTTL